jgi:hypothetical protein
MARVQPEKKLTDKIIAALRKEGAFAVKIHGGTFQSRGLSDIVSCLDGFFISLEVKVPGKDLQRKKLWQIYDAGGVGMMVTSVEQALGVVRDVKARKRRKPNVEPYEG